MRDEIVFYGHVDDEGQLKIYNREDFIERCKSFSSSSIELIVKRRTSKIGNQIRRYYFGVIVPEVQEAWKSAGYIKSREDVDSELRNMFLYKEILNEEEGTYEKVPHTLRAKETEVSYKMMKDYCEMIIIWAVESLDWEIPFPHEQIEREEIAMRKNTTF